MGIVLESMFELIGIMAVVLAILYAVWLVGMYLTDTNNKVTRILEILEEEESEDKE